MDNNNGKDEMSIYEESIYNAKFIQLIELPCP